MKLILSAALAVLFLVFNREVALILLCLTRPQGGRYDSSMNDPEKP